MTGEPSTGQAASAQGSTDGLHPSHDLGAVLQHPMRFVLPKGPAAPVPYPVGGGGPCSVRCSAPSRRLCTVLGGDVGRWRWHRCLLRSELGPL